MKVNGVLLLLLLLVVVFDSILFIVRVPLWMLCRLIFYYFVFRTDERMTDDPCYYFYC